MMLFVCLFRRGGGAHLIFSTEKSRAILPSIASAGAGGAIKPRGGGKLRNCVSFPAPIDGTDSASSALALSRCLPLPEKGEGRCLMPGDDNLCQYGGMGAHSPCLLGTGGRKAEPIKMGEVFPVFPAQKKLSALSVLFFVYFLFYSLGGFHLFPFFWAAVFIAIYGCVNQLHTKKSPPHSRSFPYTQSDGTMGIKGS